MKVVVTKPAFYGGQRLFKGDEININLRKGETLPSWASPKKVAAVHVQDAAVASSEAAAPADLQWIDEVAEVRDTETTAAPQGEDESGAVEGGTAEGGSADDADLL